MHTVLYIIYGVAYAHRVLRGCHGPQVLREANVLGMRYEPTFATRFEGGPNETSSTWGTDKRSIYLSLSL